MKHTKDAILKLLAEIPDPEIPVINIIELGIVRDVEVNGQVKVVVTPTYSGCPATKMIEDGIRTHLRHNGIDAEVVTKLSPVWTTDWITEEARQKLFEYGIAPPEQPTSDKDAITGGTPKRCPNCKSENTRLQSQFGSTPCKALYVCNDCQEPFDYFKCLK